MKDTCHLNVEMKRRNYCCDASRDLYEQYYSRQNGGEITPYVGRRFQKGHGLGNLLGGLFRNIILPFGKSLLPHGKTLLKTAMKTGSQVVGDVLQGQSVKESAKRRIPEGIKETIDNVILQSPPKVEKKPQPTAKKKKKKKRRRDIFS
jgi:hypothetical protein